MQMQALNFARAISDARKGEVETRIRNQLRETRVRGTTLCASLYLSLV